MKITLRAWVIFIVLALTGVAIWQKLSLPEFSFVDLSVDRKKAFQKASDYLKKRGVEPSKYSRAIIFVSDRDADRYLQRAMGFKGEEDFIKAHRYNLFSWAVRFYQENKKEEYRVYISSKTGGVVYFRHDIEDTAARITLDKEVAKERVKEFLKQNLAIDFGEYDFHSESIKKYDNRVDYSFSWEKKNVHLPWDKAKDAGVARLLTGATISGEEIIKFFSPNLDIPEKFTRFIQNQMYTGQLVTSITLFFYLIWVAWAVVVMARKKNYWLMHLSKNFFIYIGVSMLLLNILSVFNEFQSILYDYDTSASYNSYLGYYLISLIINFIFISVTIVVSGIAGESLRYDAFPKKGQSSFVHYLSSTFCSRGVAYSICLGYLVFLVVLGLQSMVFHLGQKFLGVWVEHTRLTQLSTSYLPFLGALIIGYQASLNEEITFRLFGMSWAKKYLKNIFLASILVSLIWGFGHSEYPVFPIWFRGLEVGTMGLVFAFLFLRYGIICLLVAHYLFDVFWGVAGYLIGKASVYLFCTSVGILAIPLIFAAVAYFLNRPEKERELGATLDKQQLYNQKILVTYLQEKLKQGVSLNDLKNEMIANGWDKVLVELAAKEAA